MEPKHPMIQLTRLQWSDNTDHIRIWSPCVSKISPHVKQRLETFSSSSLVLLIVCPLFFLFTPSCHTSAPFFIWYLSSEPNMHNIEFQVTFLSLVADCLGHGCLGSSISIFHYFSWDGLWSTYKLRNWTQLSKMFLSVVCFYFQTCWHCWLGFRSLKRYTCVFKCLKMLPSTFKWNVETRKTEIPASNEYPCVRYRFQITSPAKKTQTQKNPQNNQP